MLNIIQQRFTLSRNGAKDFIKAVFFTVLLNIALMLPAVYFFIFLESYLTEVFLNEAGQDAGTGFYILLALGFLLVMYVIAIFQYRSSYTSVYEESANRRLSLAEKLRRLPLAFFGEKNLSDLTSTLMEDSTEMETVFSHTVPQLFASLVSIFLISAGLFFYNWQLTLALLWVVPIAFIIILLSKRMQYKAFSSIYLHKRDVTEKIQEGLDTIQEIKSYNKETQYLAELNNKADRYEKGLIKGELMVGALINASQGFLKLGMASVIILGANLLASGSINLLTYLVFLLVSSRIYTPVSDVFNNLAALYYLDVRINRIKEMQRMPIQQGDTDFSPKNYDIEFDGVDFAYEEGKGVLKNVSFIAKQGEVTALVGPSGGGKSTVAKLAARFWDASKGKVLLGGQNVANIDPETLLKYYSVVFQDVVLFNTSVMDNIRIGKREATDKDVIKVAKLAQCDEFISKMPDGYNTIIGENGDTLSGGERQRISIARALLKDAPIVLLDEATASLDVENETKIQSAISELVREKTVLIIAHRMRTVANADKIVVLESGRVAETGSPAELKTKQGVFAKMLERQMQTWSSPT
jgi:ATP-binding cassette, subfamily B, bacterial IrtB/YbtQ